MSLEHMLTVAAIALPIVGAGAWQTWDYEFRHKPMSQAMWAWVEYERCRDTVREAQLRICKDMQVPEEQCPIDLSQCDKYKEKE